MSNTQQYSTEDLDELTDALASQGTDEIRVTEAADLDVVLTEIGGKAQSAVDVAAKIDAIEDALASQGTDKLQVEQQSPVGIEDSGGSQVDPVDAGQFGPFHDRVTSAATNATINPGRYGNGATIVADTSGAATLTVEVSNDGASWSAYTVSIGGSEGVKETVDGFANVRAQVDQNLNSLEISSKGV